MNCEEQIIKLLLIHLVAAVGFWLPGTCVLSMNYVGTLALTGLDVLLGAERRGNSGVASPL